MANTLSQVGIQGYQGGVIFDQTLLLQEIVDGLGVYNMAPAAYIDKYCQTHTRQNLRVSQAPKDWQRMADGGNPEASRMSYRVLTAPLNNWDLNSEMTILWLQDALASDVYNELEGAMLGHVSLVNQLFWRGVFTPGASVSSAGVQGATAYQVGFWNGETDVPPYKNNSFGSAHFHYLGSNTATFTAAVARTMKQDIVEHGYSENSTIDAYLNTLSQVDVLAMSNSNTTILQAATPQRVKSIDQGALNTDLIIDNVRYHFDDDVPAGYVAMLSSDVKPLIKRVHPNPAYQGLQMFSETPNEQYPLAGMKFLDRLGFAVQMMGAGTVRQIVASTSYTTPTFRLGG